jgi:hypothetical protein
MLLGNIKGLALRARRIGLRARYKRSPGLEVNIFIGLINILNMPISGERLVTAPEEVRSEALARSG